MICFIRNIYHGKNSKFNRISIVNHVLTTVSHTEDRLHYNVSYQNVAFSLKMKGVFLLLSRKPFFFLLKSQTDFALLSVLKSGESGIKNTDSSQKPHPGTKYRLKSVACLKLKVIDVKLYLT